MHAWESSLFTLFNVMNMLVFGVLLYVHFYKLWETSIKVCMVIGLSLLQPAPQIIYSMENTKINKQEEFYVCKMPQNYSDENAPAQQQVHVGISKKWDNGVRFKCQKQVEIFLRHQKTLTRSSSAQQIRDKLQLSVDLVKGHPEALETQYNQKIQNSQVGFHSGSKRYGRLQYSKQPKICIVTLQRYGLFKTSPFLQVSVLNLQARIQFCLTKIRKIEEFQTGIHEIRRNRSTLLFVVENIDSIQQFFGKNKVELQKILKSFAPLDGLGPVAGLQEGSFFWMSKYGKKYSSEEYYKKFEDFINAFEKYSFIRQSLVKNLMSLENTPNFDLWSQVFILSYNLSSILIQIGKDSYKQQIQYYVPHIQGCIREANRLQNQRQPKINHKNHFPVILANAHVCWRCKARGHVSCQTCSMDEGKTVAICLQCYKPYHESIPFGVEQECQNVLVKEWEEIDEEVDRTISVQLMPWALCSEWCVKKQQH